MLHGQQRDENDKPGSSQDDTKATMEVNQKRKA